jgi:membrane peptidoglycan carboxypeptidase
MAGNRPLLASFRGSLIRLHKDLFEIEELTWYVDNSPSLTKIELMVLLLEDRRFFRHWGFDWRSAARNAIYLLLRMKLGATSTIDMQLFRTVSGRYERTLRRKLREILGAVLMQRRFSKLQILRAYLARAYFGTGLESAAQATRALYPHCINIYGGVDDREMTLQQAAVIASLLVYPKPRLINVNWQTKVTRRANYGVGLFRNKKEVLQQLPS